MTAFLRDYEHFYIDGGWIEPSGSNTDTVINPATEEPIATVPVGTKAEADRALDAARKAFDDGPWPQMTHKERVEILDRFCEIVHRRNDELKSLIVAEIGAPQMLAQMLHIDTPMSLTEHQLEIARARNPIGALPPQRGSTPQGGRVLGQDVVVREPSGVVTAITPFNFPFFLNMVKIIPALAVGCTVVLKPSPLTPLQGLLLGDIAEEAGLPPGVLNILTGELEVGEMLTTDPRVDLVTFTGSDVVGSKVMEQGAPTLKRVLLELGGKSAMILREDADVDAAAQTGLQQITIQAGQGCALLTRHLVHRSLYDAYLEKVTGMIGHLNIGDPADPSVTMGPLISGAQRERVERYVEEGLQAGARLVAGGKRPEGLERGYFYEPTLFADVDSPMTIAQDEIFGPVGVVIPFDTDEEAVRIANDSRYGLAGGIWSADAATAFEMALQIRTGRVAVNGGGPRNPAVPFGGYKRSGIGREWGEEGLNEYTELKTVSVRV